MFLIAERDYAVRISRVRLSVLRRVIRRLQVAAVVDVHKDHALAPGVPLVGIELLLHLPRHRQLDRALRVERHAQLGLMLRREHGQVHRRLTEQFVCGEGVESKLLVHVEALDQDARIQQLAQRHPLWSVVLIFLVLVNTAVFEGLLPFGVERLLSGLALSHLPAQLDLAVRVAHVCFSVSGRVVRRLQSLAAVQYDTHHALALELQVHFLSDGLPFFKLELPLPLLRCLLHLDLFLDRHHLPLLLRRDPPCGHGRRMPRPLPSRLTQVHHHLRLPGHAARLRRLLMASEYVIDEIGARLCAPESNLMAPDCTLQLGGSFHRPRSTVDQLRRRWSASRGLLGQCRGLLGQCRRLLCQRRCLLCQCRGPLCQRRCLLCQRRCLLGQTALWLRRARWRAHAAARLNVEVGEVRVVNYFEQTRVEELPRRLRWARRWTRRRSARASSPPAAR